MRQRARSRRTTPRGTLLAGAATAAALGAVVACVGDEPTLTRAPLPLAEDAAPAPSPDGGDEAEAAATPTEEAGADAGLGDADASSRFCATQAAGAGVRDFFCADFDGADLTEGFTSINLPDGGSITRITDVAYSAPSSIATQGNASLVWEKTDPVNFSELEVSMRLNVGSQLGSPPPSDGSTTIFELAAGPTTVRFSFARGAIIDGATGYTGYFVSSITCPSACTSTLKRVSSIPVNVWTLIRLRWTSAGAGELWIDGEQAFAGPLHSAAASKVTVRTGLRALGSAPVTPRHAFDNLTISVRR